MNRAFSAPSVEGGRIPGGVAPGCQWGSAVGARNLRRASDPMRGPN